MALRESIWRACAQRSLRALRNFARLPRA